ncbi:hypothetical protein GGR55DRAFT_649241 [Xylaria sp. FL0064]|nr:hypothetical protein GGR55DRAFT_649241 [Xylaria sp. FL0064]
MEGLCVGLLLFLGLELRRGGWWLRSDRNTPVCSFYALTDTLFHGYPKSFVSREWRGEWNAIWLHICCNLVPQTL